MNETPSPEISEAEADDLLPEYQFDYSRANPNRFVDSRVVVLDEDVAQVFTTAEAVNKALRAIIEAMPKPKDSAA